MEKHEGIKLKQKDHINSFTKILELGTLTHTLFGILEYIASEVLPDKAHGKPVDWWTLGIPFFDEDPMGIYRKIVADKVYFMKYLDSDAKSLVKHLLTADISKH